MDIGKIINHLSSRLRSRSQEVHTKLGIGNAQGKILNFILVESALHPVYQKDIEKEFSLRPPTVTEMLKSLEARELILRIPDEQDGRFKRIVFTEKAAAVKDALNKEIHETFFRECSTEVSSRRTEKRAIPSEIWESDFRSA